MRDFNTWLEKMRPSINSFRYYVDFEKVYQNTKEIKIELNILNSLVGSQDFDNEFCGLVEKYPEVLKCIPILLAVRQNEIYAQDEDGGGIYTFSDVCLPVEKYLEFMKKTGLDELISKNIVHDLVDYVLGVETGLDSNGRKNRGGHQMEDLVEGYIKQTGIQYFKEMYLEEVESMWGIDLSSVSGEGASTKRWDFVVRTATKIYMIETNFYASSGSKLNETARSYKMLAQEIAPISSVEFVWITDGAGWRNAKGNLKETFCAMKYIFNIDDLENGALKKLFSE